jgi:uncharacterized oligopeptide transporter (OPT) family protein
MSTPNSQTPRVAPTNRELTVMSLSTGLILSVVMGAANVYLGLRVGMTIAVGIYLPAEMSVPILIGGILNCLIKRGRSSDAAEKRGGLLASGIIAGESLMGVLLGLLAFLGWTSLKLGESVSPNLIETISLLVLAAVLVAMYRFAAGKNNSAATKSETESGIDRDTGNGDD